MRYVTLGTAGHIDHGKSTLVKAMTGTDPDRLKEEKERGITIDLGFANLDYPETDLTVGIVDVPGHERLVRNMLAGAGGIDLVLLVIAADEGVMPQSREHLQICELLKIKNGIVAITKSDLVDGEWLELVTEEVRQFVKGTFLENAPVIPVSARDGSNIGLLKEKIRELALAVKSEKPTGGLFRLPIDRVFVLKGFGTVITGTALSGTVRLDEAVEVLPRGLQSRVRGIQSHGKAVDRAFAGQRAALNLIGVEKEDLNRGDVVVSPGRFRPSNALDVKFELLAGAPPVKTGDRVHFHLATSETVARLILYGREQLKEGESCYGQARLAAPVVAQATDRFVMRRFSPLETVGGGSVLDPSPARRRRKDPLDDLEAYETGPLKEKLARKILSAGLKGAPKAELEGWIKADVNSIEAALKKLSEGGQVIFVGDMALHGQAFRQAREKAVKALSGFHRQNPLKPGMPKEELRTVLRAEQKVFAGLLQTAEEIIVEKDLARLKGFRAELSGEDEEIKKKIVREQEGAGFQPLFRDELAKKLGLDDKKLADILKLMAKEGGMVRITDQLYITTGTYGKLIGLLKEFFSKKPEMTVAEFRDTLGTTRKYALPFLEFLDSNRVTMRVGDVRKLLIK